MLEVNQQRRVLLRWMLGVILMGGVANASTETKDAPPSVAASAKPAKPALEKGMDAAAVVRVIGKPDSVAPMASPEGKAETWTYRRLLNKTTKQTIASVQAVPSFNGSAGTGTDYSQMRPEFKYGFEHISTFQVTQILMFNGSLVTAKQWTQREKTFN